MAASATLAVAGVRSSIHTMSRDIPFATLNLIGSLLGRRCARPVRRRTLPVPSFETDPCCHLLALLGHTTWCEHKVAEDAWRRACLLIVFKRYNLDHPFQDSVLTPGILPVILAMIGDDGKIGTNVHPTYPKWTTAGYVRAFAVAPPGMMSRSEPVYTEPPVPVPRTFAVNRFYTSVFCEANAIGWPGHENLLLNAMERRLRCNEPPGNLRGTAFHALWFATRFTPQERSWKQPDPRRKRKLLV